MIQVGIIKEPYVGTSSYWLKSKKKRNTHWENVLVGAVRNMRHDWKHPLQYVFKIKFENNLESTFESIKLTIC